jgi:hypothetical protein
MCFGPLGANGWRGLVGHFCMKALNYLLAGVIGATIATWVAWRAAEVSSNQPSLPAPTVVRPPTPPGASPVEFARLQQEKTALDEQLAEVRSQLAERDAVLTQTKASLEELRRPMTADIMSSSLRAELKSGEVVVTGGYKLTNGKRLYALAQPVIEQVDGQTVVKIVSRFLSLTDEAGLAVGMDSIATDAANTLQHGEVWVADEQTAVLAKLNASPDVDLLTYPSITMRPGGSGMIELGDLKLKVTPVISEDGKKMDVEVRLEQPQVPLAEETPEPAVNP